jgi:hypothetical protein
MEITKQDITQGIAAHTVFKFMDDHNIILSYVGDLNHSTTTSLLKNLQKTLQHLEPNVTIRKKIYNVMVECLDNIAKYNEKQETEKFMGRTAPIMFMFSVVSGLYTITTGNHLKNTEVPLLKENLDAMNTSDKTELKSMYRKVISDTLKQQDKEGGLGLIDIAIKSGGKFKYEFRQVSGVLSFYMLQIEINTKNII